MRPWLVTCLLLALPGCTFLGKFRPVTRTMTRVTGPTGWYRVNPLLGLDLKGNVTIPPREGVRNEDDPEQDDDGDWDETVPLAERIQARYLRQFSPLIVTPETACNYLAPAESARPVYVLIHGIAGPGAEWWPVIPTLSAGRPDGMFLFRWNVTQSRTEIVDALVTGINRIAACHPGHTIVLAHSAGGVVISFAASHLRVQAEVDVFTVASPLAGAGIHNRLEDEDGANRFMKDLGATKRGFPAAAANVLVTHLRTQFPGDPVMEPKFGQHPPNMHGVGVQGATEIDLPSTLNHDGALLYVARRLVKYKGSTSVLDGAP